MGNCALVLSRFNARYATAIIRLGINQMSLTVTPSNPESLGLMMRVRDELCKEHNRGPRQDNNNRHHGSQSKHCTHTTECYPGCQG